VHTKALVDGIETAIGGCRPKNATIQIDTKVFQFEDLLNKEYVEIPAIHSKQGVEICVLYPTHADKVVRKDAIPTVPAPLQSSHNHRLQSLFEVHPEAEVLLDSKRWVPKRPCTKDMVEISRQLKIYCEYYVKNGYTVSLNYCSVMLMMKQHAGHYADARLGFIPHKILRSQAV